MTDAEAKEIISNHLHVCGTLTCRKCMSIIHSLTALDEREELVRALADAADIVDPEAYPGTVRWRDIIASARRHMEGK